MADEVFAGKYQTPEALESGYRAIAEKLKIPVPPGKLYGEGGHFKSIADIENGYKEMERLVGKIGSKKADEPKPDEVTKTDEANKPTGEPNKTATPQATPKPSPTSTGVQLPPTDQPNQDGEEVDVPKILAKAGLDPKAIEEQWSTNGKLTDEQYAALHKANPGLNRGVVNHIAEGLAAKAALAKVAVERSVSEAMQLAGGKDQFEQLLAVAPSILDPNEIAEFNKRLDNPSTIGAAIKDLMGRHALAVGSGKSNPIITGGVSTSSGGPKNLREFNDLLRRAASGDPAAIKAALAVPDETIRSWRS